LCCLGCTPKLTAQDHFHQISKAKDWKLEFSDPCTKNWEKNWFLDGELATIKNTKDGMFFSAGPENRNNAHHAVLWTKDSFSGDIKIEYDYTRTDSQVINVNILFIQATGKGDGEFAKDITQWNDYRKVPTMSKYWLNMNTIHISYAAFPMVNDDPNNDYLRVRRYPASNRETFDETEVTPAYFNTGLFQSGVTYHMTWIRHADKLYLQVSGNGEEKGYEWDLSGFDPITEGRIGLRHMFTRSARYKNFKVYTK
tara:strand:- start:324 stop:1085 length:762 start_codon:yes stop_codon:yes gene_type:complete